MKLKAYSVGHPDGDCTDLIYAHNRGQAIYIALHACMCCDDSFFTDLRAHRAPGADGMNTKDYPHEANDNDAALIAGGWNMHEYA